MVNLIKLKEMLSKVIKKMTNNVHFTNSLKIAWVKIYLNVENKGKLKKAEMDL